MDHESRANVKVILHIRSSKKIYLYFSCQKIRIFWESTKVFSPTTHSTQRLRFPPLFYNLGGFAQVVTVRWSYHRSSYNRITFFLYHAFISLAIWVLSDLRNVFKSLDMQLNEVIYSKYVDIRIFFWNTYLLREKLYFNL